MGAGGGGGGGGGGAGGVGGVSGPAPTGTSGGGTGAVINTSGISYGAPGYGRSARFVTTSRKAAASSSMPIRSLIEPLNSYIQATRGLT